AELQASDGRGPTMGRHAVGQSWRHAHRGAGRCGVLDRSSARMSCGLRRQGDEARALSVRRGVRLALTPGRSRALLARMRLSLRKAESRRDLASGSRGEMWAGRGGRLPVTWRCYARGRSFPSMGYGKSQVDDATTALDQRVPLNLMAERRRPRLSWQDTN